MGWDFGYIQYTEYIVFPSNPKPHNEIRKIMIFNFNPREEVDLDEHFN